MLTFIQTIYISSEGSISVALCGTRPAFQPEMWQACSTSHPSLPKGTSPACCQQRGTEC